MTLSDPAAVQQRLEDIEAQLAEKQNRYEDAALAWFKQRRFREMRNAEEFVKATGSAAQRKASADFATALIGSDEEARFEALRASIRTLEARATIGQSILRAQARA
jgi:hypothetical protein